MHFLSLSARLLSVFLLTDSTSGQASSTYSCGPAPGFNASNSQLDAYMSHGCGQETTEQYMARVNRTVYHPVSIDEGETCLLWDPSCKGDRTKALQKFFGSTDGGIYASLLNDPCFPTGGPGKNSCTGTRTIPPASSAIYSTVKSWMRTGTDCLSDSFLAHHMAYGYEDDPATSSGALPLERGSCCGVCGVNGDNVDVYYWPVSGANTDCLSIVGTASLPPLSGASVVDGSTCWGNSATPCTAVYTSVGGLTWKQMLVNPWYTSPTGAPLAKRDAEIIASPLQNFEPPLQARGRPIALPILRRAYVNGSMGEMPSNRSVSGNDTAHASTVVFEGHTFTSPSIYVNFYSLTATDQCGWVGSQKFVSSTMVAFAPGELSTVLAPDQPAEVAGSVVGTRYNFADLPCPPMSIMTQAFWKPEAGNPYRPIIAFPSRLRSIDPAWSACGAGYFGGWDPPRTLEVASAMAPNPTPASENSDPNAGPAAPASTHDPLPQNTNGPQMVPPPTQSMGIGGHIMFGFAHTPSTTEAAPTSQPTADDPQQGTSGSNPTQQETASDPKDSTEKQDQSPEDPRSSPNPALNDPSNENMSALEQALAPTKTATTNPASAGTTPQNVGSNQNDAGNNDKSDGQVSNSDNAPAPQPQTSEGSKTPDQGSNDGQTGENSQSSPQNNSNEQEDPNKASGQDQQHDSTPTLPNSSPETSEGPGGNAGSNDDFSKTAPNENESSNDETGNDANKSQPSQNSAGGNKAAAPNDSAPNDAETGSNGSGNAPSDSSADGTKAAAPNDSGPDSGGTGQSGNGNGNGNDSSGDSSSDDQTTENNGSSDSTSENSPAGIQDGAEQHDDAPNSDSASNQGNGDAGVAQTYHLPSLAPTAPATVAGHLVQPQSSGALVDGQTIKYGAPPSTISGTAVSIDASHNIYIGSDSYPIPSSPPTSATAAENVAIPLPNGATAVALPKSGGVSIYGATLFPGAHTTISGKVVSLDSSSNLIYEGTQAPAVEKNGYGPVTTVASQAVTPVANGVLIGGTKVENGAPAITLGGTKISYGHSMLVMGTSSIPLPLASPTSNPEQGPVTTVANHAVTPISNGAIINGATVSDGAPATTISGTPVFFAHSTLVFGSSSVPLTLPSSNSGPVTTVANKAVTPVPNGAIINGATISDGASAITISGTPIFLSHSTLAIGSSSATLVLPSAGQGSVTTVAHKAVTPLSQGVEVAGSTLMNNGPAQTISGTIMSFGHSKLVVGNSSVSLDLPTASVSSSGGSLTGSATTSSNGNSNGPPTPTQKGGAVPARQGVSLQVMVICGLGLLFSFRILG